jgi:hypothetical protein
VQAALLEETEVLSRQGANQSPHSRKEVAVNRDIIKKYGRGRGGIS